MKALNIYREFALICMAVVLLTGCGGESQPPGSGGGAGGFGMMQRGGPASVEVAPVTTSSISEQVRSFGNVRAQDVVTISPQVGNRITEIHVDLGDTVQQGQVMARIYDLPYRDALEQAEASLRQSRSAFERDSSQFVRQRTLFESSAISSSEYDDARATFESSRAQYESARAALTSSREDLANTEVRSPVHGVVLNRMIAEGDIASTGQEAFEVANLVGYETRLFLPMQDWENIRVGLPVEFYLTNREGVAARGNISRISPQLNPNTGLGEIVVSLTDVTPSIRQGVLVDSRITLVTHENAIVIPRSALIEQVETYIEPETNTVEIRTNYSAFIAQGDSVAIRRDLTLGMQQGERIEVLSGLDEGDRLIVTGHRNLNDNALIRIAGQGSERDNLQSIGEEDRRGRTSPGGGPGNQSQSEQGGEQ